MRSLGRRGLSSIGLFSMVGFVAVAFLLVSCASSDTNAASPMTSTKMAKAKMNPCNPCAAKAKMNPCNPCAAKAKMNPCNPCAAKAKMNPCNPCAAKNPCNPCSAGQRVNPKLVTRPAGSRLYAGSRVQLVAEGKKLWEDRTLGTTGLACSSCHMNFASFKSSFLKPYSHQVEMPLQRAGLQQIDLDEMVQFCMVVPMASKPLAWNSRELAALTAYAQQVQKGFVKAVAANPCMLKQAAANPCNPCAAKAKMNPCNPCAAKAKMNPCNPCAAKAKMNPCNPCAAKAKMNPCNPCAAKNPCGKRY